MNSRKISTRSSSAVKSSSAWPGSHSPPLLRRISSDRSTPATWGIKDATPSRNPAGKRVSNLVVPLRASDTCTSEWVGKADCHGDVIGRPSQAGFNPNPSKEARVAKPESLSQKKKSSNATPHTNTRGTRAAPQWELKNKTLHPSCKQLSRGTESRQGRKMPNQEKI